MIDLLSTLALAAEALTDAAKATPGPWEWSGPGDDIVGPPCQPDWSDDPEEALRSRERIVTTDSGYYGPNAEDARFIINARSREPQLAEACLAMAEELSDLSDKLRVVTEQNDALGDANVLAVENERLQEQLAAMTAARNEACVIALLWVQGGHQQASEVRERVAALRQVGEAK